MTTTQAPDLEQRMSQFSTYEDTVEDTFQLYRDAHAAGKTVFFSEKQGGFWNFIDYADVKAAHSDPETYNSGPQVLRPLAERPSFPPIEYDGELHKEWRKLFAEALNVNTPKLYGDSIKADIERLTAELAAKKGEEVDIQATYAEDIPLLALCHVLGFDQEKRDMVRWHTVEMHKHAGDPEKGAAAFMAFGEFGAGEVMRHVQEGLDTYLATLGTWQIEGRPLSPPELGATMNSFLNAGHGTTVSGLTSLIYEIFTRPDVKQQLLDDPSLIEAAVDESMRLHTPFFGLFRMTTKPVTVGGVDLEPGSSILMHWAGANRDPKVFENPDEFILGRNTGHNRLMTFGFGVHACMGQPTARFEMNNALAELLKQVPDMEIVDPENVEHTFAGSETALIKSLPVRIPA